MGVTNYQCTINTFVLLVKEYGVAELVLKQVNTRSYIYTIRASYSNNTGLKYQVDKAHVNGKFLGTIDIHRVAKCGAEYSTTSLGRLPSSVNKFIEMSYRDILTSLNINDWGMQY